MVLKVHGLRMAVLTKIIPRKIKAQGVVFKLCNIHSLKGNFWFEIEIDLLNEIIEILPTPKVVYEELKTNHFQYPVLETEKQFCKDKLEKETNWLKIINLLDEELKGLHAFTTADGQYQITLLFFS